MSQNFNVHKYVTNKLYTVNSKTKAKIVAKKLLLNGLHPNKRPPGLSNANQTTLNEIAKLLTPLLQVHTPIGQKILNEIAQLSIGRGKNYVRRPRTPPSKPCNTNPKHSSKKKSWSRVRSNPAYNEWMKQAEQDSQRVQFKESSISNNIDRYYLKLYAFLKRANLLHKNILENDRVESVAKFLFNDPNDPVKWHPEIQTFINKYTHGKVQDLRDFIRCSRKGKEFSINQILKRKSNIQPKDFYNKIPQGSHEIPPQTPRSKNSPPNRPKPPQNRPQTPSNRPKTSPKTYTNRIYNFFRGVTGR